jgi:hypothetical protein
LKLCAPKRPGSARRVVLLGFRHEGVKLAGGGVALDLRVPSLPVLLKDPVAQFSELGAGQLPDLHFDMLNLVHAGHLKVGIPDVGTAVISSANTRINGRVPSSRWALYPTRTVAS